MTDDDCPSVPGVSGPPVAIRVCRFCAKGIVRVLSLGNQIPANTYVLPGDPPAPRYPLDYAICRACGLLQLESVVPPEDLYGTYAYRSKGSLAVARHAVDLAQRFGGEGKFVVEVASNDGLFLEEMQRTGSRVLGVEPAENIAADAVRAGVPTVVEFFDAGLGAEIAEDQGQADVILARNVVGHLPEPHGFLRGCVALLKNEGVLIVEAPSLMEVFTHRDYTYLYHEHVSLLGAWNMARLVAQHDLTLTDVVHVDLHGGSTQFQIRKRGWSSASVLKMQAAESAAGALRESGWEFFAKAAERNRDNVVAGLAALRDAGRRVAGYTAPAKLSVLCQWAGIGKDLLPVVYDTTPEKVGRLVPGTDILIEDPARMQEYHPDALFVGAHNLAAEIKKRTPNNTLYRAIPEWGEVS